MKNTLLLIASALFAANFLCCNNTIAQTVKCSDVNATPETRKLYQKLSNQINKGVMFGHQDDLAYGVTWRYEDGRSDVKEVTGDYPAVIGWDLANLELDSARNIDLVPFKKMQQYIKDTYNRGGITTLSWHFNNPVTQRSAWSDIKPNTVTAILPGGAQHEKYKAWLDKMVVFLAELKGNDGKAIPIIFRPFHEFSGNWFWWCQNVTSAQDFKAIWRFTVSYLRNQKQVHNLIMHYNSAELENVKQYEEYYPGDDVVDMVSFDTYAFGNGAKADSAFTAHMTTSIARVTAFAKQHNKLATIGETGYEAIPNSKWWTTVLWPVLKDKPLSYVLIWRNHGYLASANKMHYYVPFKGQKSEEDFKKFYNLKQTLFERDVNK